MEARGQLSHDVAVASAREQHIELISSHFDSAMAALLDAGAGGGGGPGDQPRGVGFGGPSPDSAIGSLLSEAEAAIGQGEAQQLKGELDAMLAEFVAAAGLEPGNRILDCGAGGGALIPHIKAAGVTDIVAVDVAPLPLTVLKERHDDVTCWLGDALDLPPEYGDFDAVFCDGVLEHVLSPPDFIRSLAARTKAGGRLVICQAAGRAWAEAARAQSPRLFPSELPREEELQALVEDGTLPPGTKVLEFSDPPPGPYVAVLQVGPFSDEAPEEVRVTLLTAEEGEAEGDRGAGASTSEGGGDSWRLDPIVLQGRVVAGFGRGSRQMGIPTANLPPEELEEQLRRMPKGVYFGWAQLAAGEGADLAVRKMVVNVGERPTFAGGGGVTVEVHVMHDFGRDFYGEELRCVVLGFIRPEMKFASVEELVGRIREDIAIASGALDAEPLAEYKSHGSFVKP